MNRLVDNYSLFIKEALQDIGKLIVTVLCEGYLKQYQGVDKIINTYGEKLPDSHTTIYWRMTQDYGIHYCKMLIEWYDECVLKLEAEDDEGFNN